MKRAVVLALALSGCPKPTSEGTDASPAASSAPPVVVRYDCAGIAPVVEAGTCNAAERPTDELVHLSEKLTELAGMHRAPEQEWWTPARAALDAATKANLDPKSLSLVERVMIQNAALHLAVSARAVRVRDGLANDAWKLVERLAFNPDERAQAAAISVDLTGWLGPAADRIERNKATPFFHEQVAHETRIFRLVRTPKLRANFSELVAVDTDGKPFVTGVVASMEFRKGTGLDAPACVAFLAPDRVRCAPSDALVEARDFMKLPQSYFLRHDERGELRCNDCHGPSGNESLIGAIDLAPDAVPAALDDHRRATLKKLDALIEPLRPASPKR